MRRSSALSAAALLALGIVVSWAQRTSGQATAAAFQGLLPGLITDSVGSLADPTFLQSILLGKQPLALNPFLGSAATNGTSGIAGVFEQLLGGGNPLAFPFLPQDATPPNNILQSIIKGPGGDPGNRPSAAAAAAAGGVVANALFLASGITLTVTGGLGSAYAAMSEQLGLIGGLGARVNLGFEYTKAGLGALEQAAKSTEELTAEFLTWAGDAPGGLERVAEVRNALSGTFRNRLLGLQGQVVSAGKALRLARATAAAALG